MHANLHIFVYKWFNKKFIVFVCALYKVCHCGISGGSIKKEQCQLTVTLLF